MKKESRKDRSLKKIQLKNGCKAGKKIAFRTVVNPNVYDTDEKRKDLQIKEINKYWKYLQDNLKVDFPMHAIEQEMYYSEKDALNGTITIKTVFKRVN